MPGSDWWEGQLCEKLEVLACHCCTRSYSKDKITIGVRIGDVTLVRIGADEAVQSSINPRSFYILTCEL
jgi:hypothetical protein